MACKFEIYQSPKNNEWYWRFKAANGQIVATGGEGYKEKESCRHGLEVVKDNAADAPVEDLDGE